MRALLLASTALLFTAPALAQSDPGSPDDQAGDAQEAPTDEILVTAQRVAERLQEVPVSVTAVTGEDLREANITDATRLAELTPGLTIGRSGSDLRPAIRGVRTENVGANADPTIGFFIDGVYQSRTTQALAAFVDLERVEVLRGPQGTLFGRNTYGGAINLITAKPRDELGAGVDVLYGRFDRVRVESFLNLPASQAISFRVAAMIENADGYVNNIGAGNDLGDEDQVYIRPSLRVASGAFDLVVQGQYWRQEGAGLSAFGYKSRGTLVNPALVSATNSGRALNGTPVPVNSRLRDGIPDVNGFDIGVPILDTYTVDFDADAVRRNELTSLTADASYDLGFATIRSITGWSDFTAFRAIDNDFSPFPIAIDYNDTAVETFSQELQLVGARGGTLEWIVGGYFFDDRVREVFFNDQNNGYPLPGTPAALGPPFQAGTPTGAPFSPIRADSITPVSVRTRSYAGFAQATVNLTERFAITGGIRYTEDKKRYSRQFLSGPGLSFASGDAAPFTQRDQRATFDKVTWRIGAEYQASRDHLLYASVSTGFTSGGFNGGTFTSGGTTLALPPFDPQTVTAYEIGSKNEFADGRVRFNVAAFYNDFNGLQVQSQVPFAGTVISTTGNAGSGRSYGVEVETLVRPVEGLDLGLNATFLDAEYTSLFLNNPFPNPVLTCPAGAPIDLPVGQLRCVDVGSGLSRAQVDLDGARIPFSPRFTATFYGGYDFETGFGTIRPGFNVFYNSGYFNTDFNTALDRQDSFEKIDLRLTWTSVDERFSVQGYVENLTDRAVNLRGVFGANQSLNANYAPPRTYGIRAGVRF